MLFFLARLLINAYHLFRCTFWLSSVLPAKEAQNSSLFGLLFSSGLRNFHLKSKKYHALQNGFENLFLLMHFYFGITTTKSSFIFLRTVVLILPYKRLATGFIIFYLKWESTDVTRCFPFSDGRYQWLTVSTSSL